MTGSTPTVIPIRTVAPFFDFASAWRAVIVAFVTVVVRFWSPFTENSRHAADHDRAIIER